MITINLPMIQCIAIANTGEVSAIYVMSVIMLIYTNVLCVYKHTYKQLELNPIVFRLVDDGLLMKCKLTCTVCI